MWDIIQSMSSDRLWIWTALAGSIFGALFIAWITDTRVALWTYGKWSTLLNYLVTKWGWTWFQEDPNAWKKLNPNLSNKIVDLESRIIELENKKTLEDK